MKKMFWVLCAVGFLLFSCAGTQSGEKPLIVSLDDAIGVAVVQMERGLPQGTKIALLNFESPTEAFSEYVLEELSDLLVFGGKLVVLDRRNLDLIRQEERFQLSGEVSDESAQAIGRKLGAQMIVSGSLTSTGKTYRFRTKTLVVETAAIIESFSVDINPKENKTISLLSGARVNAETTTASAGSTEQAEYSEYTITYSGENRGFVTVKKESNNRVVVTLNFVEAMEKEGYVPLDNMICPLLPSRIFGIGAQIDTWIRNIVIDGDTITHTWPNGYWYKTVVQGNTTTTTYPNGNWQKTVVQGNTTTTTDVSGYWEQVVVQGNITTKTSSSGEK